MENFLPFNYIDDESTFLKVASEISQCQTVFENVLHESKLFNPFDINEEHMSEIRYCMRDHQVGLLSWWTQQLSRISNQSH